MLACRQKVGLHVKVFQTSRTSDFRAVRRWRLSTVARVSLESGFDFYDLVQTEPTFPVNRGQGSSVLAVRLRMLQNRAQLKVIRLLELQHPKQPSLIPYPCERKVAAKVFASYSLACCHSPPRSQAEMAAV